MGLALVAPTLLLGSFIKSFYIASSQVYDYSLKLLLNLPSAKLPFETAGISIATDHLLSTESTTIYHEAGDKSRYEKIESMEEFDLIYDSLRICWFPKGIINCCKCSKCIRTMIILKILGKLDRFSKVFPEELTREKIRNWELVHATDYEDLNSILKNANKNKEQNKDIIEDLEYAGEKWKEIIKKIKNEFIKYPKDLGYHEHNEWNIHIFHEHIIKIGIVETIHKGRLRHIIGLQ